MPFSMNGTRSRQADYTILLAFLLALPALLPLLRSGFYVSYDGLFHLYRLVALDQALHAGVLYPRWFPDFAFGYGYPVLNFYSPLSYYLAELPHLLGLGYVEALKLAFGLCLVLSAGAMYLYARETLSRAGSLVAGLAYLYVPYHLSDAYRRGAVAETAAFVFFPLLLWSAHRLVRRRVLRCALLTGILAAGLVLTHNLSALLLAPVFACYYLMLVVRELEGRAKALLWLVGAGVLALGLAAFYLVPVAAETQDVHLVYDWTRTPFPQDPAVQKDFAPVGDLISPSLIYPYVADSASAAAHPIGLAQAALAGVAIVALILGARRGRRDWTAWFWVAVGLGALFMASQASLPVWGWTHPWLAMLQFPWRFMALVDLSTAYLIGMLITVVAELKTQDRELHNGVALAEPQLGLSALMPHAAPAGESASPRSEAERGGGARGLFDSARFAPVQLALGPGVLLLLLLNALPNVANPPLPVTEAELATPLRMWQEDYEAEQIGATWAAEYLPVTVKEDRWAIPRPDYKPAAMRPLPDSTTLKLLQVSFTGMRLEVDGTAGFPLSLHAFSFPGWQAQIDGTDVAMRPTGRLGLATVDVPAGHHSVALEFRDTPARTAGGLISVVSLLAAAGLAILSWPRRVLVLSAAAAVALSAIAAWHVLPLTPTALPFQKEVKLENKVELLGYDVSPARVTPGATAQVTLYWLALRPLQTDYKVFVHLVLDGQVRAQHDGDPVYGMTLTTRWQPGEIIADRHEVVIPADAPPGDYQLLAGMYDYASRQNLVPADEAAQQQGNRVPLGTVRVLGQ